MQNTPDPIPLTETEMWYLTHMLNRASLKLAKVVMFLLFASMIMLGIGALHNVISGNATHAFEVIILFFTTPLALASAFLMVNMVMTRQTILPDKRFITGKFKVVSGKYTNFYIGEKQVTIPQDMDTAFVLLNGHQVEAWVAGSSYTNLLHREPTHDYDVVLNLEDVIDIDSAFHDPRYQEAFIAYSRVYGLGVILGALLLIGVICILVELNMPEAFIITSMLVTILIVGSFMVYFIMVVLPKTYGVTYEEILRGDIWEDDELDDD